MIKRDNALLSDMRENAQIAIDMSLGLNAEVLRYAIPALYSTLHAIQIVGGAASHVSEEARTKLPNVPWNEIIATRHIIVHGYRAVDPAIVIGIVTDHLPPLIEQIDRYLRDANS